MENVTRGGWSPHIPLQMGDHANHTIVNYLISETMKYKETVPPTPLTVLTSENPGLLILNKYSVTYGVYLVCSTLYNLQWCHNTGCASIVTYVNFPWGAN